jgi:hypothetical protein
MYLTLLYVCVRYMYMYELTQLRKIVCVYMYIIKTQLFICNSRHVSLVLMYVCLICMYVRRYVCNTDTDTYTNTQICTHACIHTIYCNNNTIFRYVICCPTLNSIQSDSLTSEWTRSSFENTYYPDVLLNSQEWNSGADLATVHKWDLGPE